MTAVSRLPIRDHFLPPDLEAFRRAPPGRVVVIAPTRAACETIELALRSNLDTVLEREHGAEIRDLAAGGRGFGIVAGTGTGKTLAIRPIAESILAAPLRVGVVNREREATPETPHWNVVVVTTGIARRWFQEALVTQRDTVVVDEIHQTSAELELCLALGKRAGCRFIWLSATVDPAFYAAYLSSATVLETTAFDPSRAARVATRRGEPDDFLDDGFLRRVLRERRGVAVFVPTRAEAERVAAAVGERWHGLTSAFYHGGEPIRAIRPFLEGAPKPYLLAMTAAGQSALNIPGLDTVVIHDARYTNIVQGGRNVLTRQYLGPNEILQMAGRVHGRVTGGEVIILTDRSLHFDSLRPVPPEFQLAGDAERVALTAAAMGIDIADLDLPVPIDKHAYQDAIRHLSNRGIIEGARLTAYGRDVEALPVDRPWAELLVTADESTIDLVAVASNIDSLHRMTREERDLRGLVVDGSDHLTAYNVYQEATAGHATVGSVYGLPRHLFNDSVEEWCEDHGVLLKALEDVALGAASVYRALERPLPAQVPTLDRGAVARFRDLLARVMPFALVVDGQLSSGDEVRLSQGSFCGPGAVAGQLRYFADRFGVPRAVIEGTNLSDGLMRRYAKRRDPTVVHVRSRRDEGLYLEQAVEYFGFLLERSRTRLEEPFSDDRATAARRELARAALAGSTSHPRTASLRQAALRLDDYWRRSGGTLGAASPARVLDAVTQNLSGVRTYRDFLSSRLWLDTDLLVPPQARERLDALPSSITVAGSPAPLRYDLEGRDPVVYVALRESQAKRIRPSDVQGMDRPTRFRVHRGHGRIMVEARSLEELRRKMSARGRRPASR